MFLGEMQQIMQPLIIPFFIPHAGCPHNCSYCNQHLTGGTASVLPHMQQVVDKVHEWTARSPDRFTEVAFFGGSFTMLPRQQQIGLLEAVQPLMDKNLVQGIRISTRPDALDNAHLALLSAYRVSTIEIGVQSLSDDVLQLASRGHCADDSLKAINRVAKAGFNTGAQLLPGLPGDSLAKALASLRGIIDAGADFVRIYPALVLAGTALAELYKKGKWQPLLLDEAVNWSAQMLLLAAREKIPVIRLGLQSDEGLIVGDTILAGPWHPAFGQLVRSKLYCNLAEQMSDKLGNKGQLGCHPARLADVVGHKRSNLIRWQQLDLEFTIRPQPELEPEQLMLQTVNGTAIGSIFCDFL
jgi:histone acetyltransferase (RNA polymerase elongator complex component)